jgi:hypothetical protein
MSQGSNYSDNRGMQIQSVQRGLLESVVVVSEHGHSSRFDIEMGTFPDYKEASPTRE